jgi:hypothetical protein
MGKPLALVAQAQWAAANAQKCVEYWRAMQETWMQTQGEVVKCLADASRKLSQPIERTDA